ncbi:hypothetical protein BH11BAC3_BH11BAC3_16980 [soil metagenome]
MSYEIFCRCKEIGSGLLSEIIFCPGLRIDSNIVAPVPTNTAEFGIALLYFFSNFEQLDVKS